MHLRQIALRPGCYRITIADADVVRCIKRTEPEDGALQVWLGLLVTLSISYLSRMLLIAL